MIMFRYLLTWLVLHLSQWINQSLSMGKVKYQEE